MTSRLHLTQGQQNEIRPILVAEFIKKKSIQDSTLSDKAKHDQIGAVHRAACQQIKKVFTPEQMAQIEQEQSHPTASSTSR